MRTKPLLRLLLLALLSGCVDATGILNDCSGEMAQARSLNGGPPNASEHDEDRGDHTEIWEFFDTDRRYIFRWGVSYDGCQVERTSLNLSPVPGASAPAPEDRG